MRTAVGASAGRLGREPAAPFCYGGSIPNAIEVQLSPDKDSSGVGPRLAPAARFAAAGGPAGFVPSDARTCKWIVRCRGVASGEIRSLEEFSPSDKKADPVLAEAFSRPYPGGDSLQRHPADAGALDAKGDPLAEEPDDPWRDPAAAAALGTPALEKPAPQVIAGPTGKLGVREVLFGGRVSYWALVTLAIIALLIGLIGGWVGRKTAEVVKRSPPRK